MWQLLVDLLAAKLLFVAPARFRRSDDVEGVSERLPGLNTTVVEAAPERFRRCGGGARRGRAGAWRQASRSGRG